MTDSYDTRNFLKEDRTEARYGTAGLPNKENTSWKVIMLISLPKQFPLKGMNILQAVAIGVSTDMRVLIIASSTLIIIAENTKQNIISYTSYGYMLQLPRK